MITTAQSKEDVKSTEKWIGYIRTSNVSEYENSLDINLFPVIDFRLSTRGVWDGIHGFSSKYVSV
jgi:hypothetical protein